MQYLGGIDFNVDGRPVDFSETLSYKGVMNSGVPNLASVFGYTNASWTLKADLICRFVCRLLNLMDNKGMRQVTPLAQAATKAGPFVQNFNPGYVQRALQNWPKQGAKAPWRVYQNYFRDILTLRFASLGNSALSFSNPTAGGSVGPSQESLARSAGASQ
jgi:hypothetical protein